MFRRPLYLDLEALVDLADWADIGLPDAAEIEQIRRRRHGGKVGISKVLNAGYEGGKEDETRVRFTEEFRPVRALNIVLDALAEEGALTDLDAEREAAISRDSVVLIEGDLQMSPLTEIGQLLSALMPSATEALGRGEEPTMDQTALARALLAGETPEGPLVFDLKPFDEHPRRYLVIGHSTAVVDSADDLVDELRVLATVKRLVRAGASRSLDRYVLPNVSRAFRRAMSGNALEDLLSGSTDVIGREIEDPQQALQLDGPAAILEPIAIF